jgi:hypothetical protein
MMEGAGSCSGRALVSVKQNCYRHRCWQRACVVRPPTSVYFVIIKSTGAAEDGRRWRGGGGGVELTCASCFVYVAFRTSSKTLQIKASFLLQPGHE